MSSEERRNNLITFIKENGNWARITDYTWCVKSNVDTTAELRDELARRIGIQSEERIMVVNMTKSAWASYNLPKNVADWLKE